MKCHIAFDAIFFTIKTGVRFSEAYCDHIVESRAISATRLATRRRTAFDRRESGLAMQDYSATTIRDLGIVRSSSRRLRLEIGHRD